MNGKILSLFRRGSLLRQMYYGGYEDFDGANGGVWKKYINIPIKTVPLEYAQYRIEIDDTNVSVYNVDWELKVQSAIASEFWELVRSDGFDIRAFDHLFRQLWFWVEKFDYTNKKAKIWVRLPENSKELNIAFGNEKASKSSYNNVDEVFEFFDDFDGLELDTNKWTPNFVNTVSYEIVDSNLRIKDATKSDGAYWIYDNTDTGSQIKANFTPLDKMIIEWKQKMETQSSASQMGQVGVGLCKEDKTVEVYLDEIDSLGSTIVYEMGYDIINGQSRTQSVNINADTYYILRIVRDSDNYKLEAIDEQGNVVYSPVTGSSTATISYMAICVGAYGGHPFEPMQIDWVRVLKFADPATFDTPKILEF